MRQGAIASSERQRRLHKTSSTLTHGPMCTACQYAKQRRKTTLGTTTKVIKQEQGALKRNDLFLGQEISIDHYHCNPVGCRLDTYGKECEDKKYKGGCIFVDHATSMVFTQLQTKLNSHETMHAMKTFEDFCAQHGVIPQSYLTDNGSQFTSKAFKAHLKELHQTARHSGAGAHHSNGIAERTIGSVTSIARAMLHHAAIHWPDAMDAQLWPLAVPHAVHLLNRIPKEDTGRNALELFSRKIWTLSKLHDFHVWGCPVYALESAPHNGNKLPRWKPRSGR